MVVHVVEDLHGKGVSDGPHLIEHDDGLRVQGKAPPAGMTPWAMLKPL